MLSVQDWIRKAIALVECRYYTVPAKMKAALDELVRLRAAIA